MYATTNTRRGGRNRTDYSLILSETDIKLLAEKNEEALEKVVILCQSLRDSDDNSGISQLVEDQLNEN